MNQNVNEAESFAGDFVASEERLLFFEVPLRENETVSVSATQARIGEMPGFQKSIKSSWTCPVLGTSERQRNAMTPLVFSAQFQQSPIPLEGNLIKRDWIRYFKGSLPRREGDYFVISGTPKASELADYSVGTVWQVQDRGAKINLVDLVRCEWLSGSA